MSASCWASDQFREGGALRASQQGKDICDLAAGAGFTRHGAGLGRRRIIGTAARLAGVVAHADSCCSMFGDD